MGFNPDQRAASVLIALAAIVFALTFTFDEVPAAVRQGMGPERFPRLVAITVAMLSGFVFFQARGRTRKHHEPIDPAVLWVIAGGVLFMGLVWLVGLTLAMVVAILALGVLWGEKRTLAMVANAVLLPGVIWLTFVKGLGVPLPHGAIGRMLGL